MLVGYWYALALAFASFFSDLFLGFLSLGSLVLVVVVGVGVVSPLERPCPLRTMLVDELDSAAAEELGTTLIFTEPGLL